MYGSFLGDIIGAPYEFDRGPRNKDFRFFAHPQSKYTDDSLLTVAIGEALMELKKVDMNHLPKGKTKKQVCMAAIKKSILKWCSDSDFEHIQDEYGTNFQLWLEGKAPKDWASFGNGSAMRVGPAGWLYDTLEETIEMAGYTAEVSHKHPEGIRGAKAVAAAIFLARTGKSKQEIKEYLGKQFGYPLDMTVAGMQKSNLFFDAATWELRSQNESCQVCVPQAIACFLEANSYEDAIRNAISIGGDTDTIAAITGSMADAFYGVPAEMRERADTYLHGKMRTVANRFLKERSHQTELAPGVLGTAQFDPVAIIEKQAKSGSLNYDAFLDQLDHLAQTSEPGSLQRKFGEFAAQAVRTGYPLSDLKDLFEVRRALDMAPGVEGEHIAEARQHCEEVWSQLLTNSRDQAAAPLTEEDRFRNLEAMKAALTAYKDAIGFMNETGRYVNDVAAYGLHQRMRAGLTPSEQMRLTGSAQEALALLDRVTPAGMRPSRAFKDLKTAYQAYLADLEDPEKQEASRQKVLDRCEAYLSYKAQQNKGMMHRRSDIEAHRVALVEALLQKVKREELAADVPAPEEQQARSLLNEAEKQLFLGGREKTVAAAMLLAAQELKQTGAPLTRAGLQAKSAQYVSANPAFQSAVSSYPAASLGTLIRNGVFQQKVEEIRQDQSFVARLPELREQWRMERSIRTARTRELRDRALAATKELTVWTESEGKKAGKKGQQAGKGTASAGNKAPASANAQKNPSAKPEGQGQKKTETAAASVQPK